MPVVDRTPGGLSGCTARGAGVTRVRGFGRDEDGATAVEFGFVAIPFLALMFAILETAIVFFAGATLETAVGDAGRLVRTGQAHEDGMNEAQFKAAVCARVLQLFDCDGNLRLDVRTYPTFDSVDFSTVVLDEDGELVTDDFSYQIGRPCEIVVIRVLYEWPTFVTRLGNNLATLPNGNHLLTAAAVFKNEPFPWDDDSQC